METNETCIELKNVYPDEYTGDNDIMKSIHDKITIYVCTPGKTEICYKKKIVKLASTHGLAFCLNPGGGEFYGGIGRCQVSTLSFEDDYADLKNWLDNINNVSKEKIECGD